MKNNFSDGDNKLLDKLLREEFLPKWLTSNSKKYQPIYTLSRNLKNAVKTNQTTVALPAMRNKEACSIHSGFRLELRQQQDEHDRILERGFYFENIKIH